MTFTNCDVKMEAASKGVKLYEIPAQLKMSTSKFNIIMRTPLSAEMREKVLNAINAIAANR